jgi:hypothetical protein
MNLEESKINDLPIAKENQNVYKNIYLQSIICILLTLLFTFLGNLFFKKPSNKAYEYLSKIEIHAYKNRYSAKFRSTLLLNVKEYLKKHNMPHVKFFIIYNGQKDNFQAIFTYKNFLISKSNFKTNKLKINKEILTLLKEVSVPYSIILGSKEHLYNFYLNFNVHNFQIFKILTTYKYLQNNYKNIKWQIKLKEDLMQCTLKQKKNFLLNMNLNTLQDLLNISSLIFEFSTCKSKFIIKDMQNYNYENYKDCTLLKILIFYANKNQDVIIDAS